MAVEILWDDEKRIACMYCTTTDSAFGPVFSGPAANVEVGEFLDWLQDEGAPSWAVAKPIQGDGRDPRDYSPGDIERLVRYWRYWCDLPTVEPDGQRYLGGGNIGSTSR